MVETGAVAHYTQVRWPSRPRRLTSKHDIYMYIQICIK
jgi:hypothetical protein